MWSMLCTDLLDSFWAVIPQTMLLFWKLRLLSGVGDWLVEYVIGNRLLKVIARLDSGCTLCYLVLVLWAVITINLISIGGGTLPENSLNLRDKTILSSIRHLLWHILGRGMRTTNTSVYLWDFFPHSKYSISLLYTMFLHLSCLAWQYLTISPSFDTLATDSGKHQYFNVSVDKFKWTLLNCL